MGDLNIYEIIGAMPASHITMICTGVFFGAFVAGFAGFGLSAAAGAFLLHVLDPVQAVPLMMFCSIIAQCAGLLHLRRTISLKSAMPFVVGGLIGTPIALMVLKGADSTMLRTWFGVFLMLYAGWAFGCRSWCQPAARLVAPGAGALVSRSPARHSVQKKGAVGFAAGLVGGVTAMPGALVAVWGDVNHKDKAAQRGFVQPFILMMQLFALCLITVTPGFLSPDLLPQLAIAAVPLALGTVSGLYLYGRADPQTFRMMILCIVLASGMGLAVPF